MAHFLVTRPQGKNTLLRDLLSELGHQVTTCPLLALAELPVSTQQLAIFDEADMVIFTSQDAVTYLHKVSPSLPPHCLYFAVGQQTADTFSSLFGYDIVVPKIQTSEGLLALEKLQQVAQKQVVIVKGEGGRTTLAKSIKRAGGIVNQLPLYQRQPASALSPELVKSWQENNVTHIILTSNAAFDALIEQCKPEASWLEKCTFYVVSERAKVYLQSRLGKNSHIVNCDGAAPETIIAKVKEHDNQMTTEKDMSDQVETVTSDDSTVNTSKPSTSNKSGSGAKVIAGVALVLSLVSLGGLGYGYMTWQQTKLEASQQRDKSQRLETELAKLNQQMLSTQRALLENQNKQQAKFDKSETMLREQIQQQLAQASEQVIAINPQEVNGLYRMVEFKAVTEQNYSAALDALTRLDAVLAEHPDTNQVRQAIHQDIQTLKGLPKVPVENLYLTLHGMINQVDQLVLNMVVLPEVKDQAQSYALSESVDDWQTNLKRSWQRLVDDFIKVRERNAPIEPLLSQQEQNLVKQQLRFYLAQAQTALMNQQAELFKVSLTQATQTLTQFFSQAHPATSALQQQLNLLANTPLAFNPEFELVTGDAIKELL